MSYDLAVWEGAQPPTIGAATSEFERRMEAMEARFESGEEAPPPSPAIRAFVDAALARFPELDDDSGEECPWASAPLLGEAAGDFIYFPLTWSGSEFAVEPLAEIAKQQVLVCYDPQVERVLPWNKGSWLSRMLGRS